MLFFRPRLNILIFLPILGCKYFCIILKLLAYDLSVLEYIGVSSIVSAGFFALLASFAIQRME